MRDQFAMQTVGATLSSAAQTLGRVHCCETPTHCWAASTADAIQNLVVDLTQLGYQSVEPNTWLPNPEWIPAAWGSRSDTPQVQVGAAYSAHYSAQDAETRSVQRAGGRIDSARQWARICTTTDGQ